MLKSCWLAHLNIGEKKKCNTFTGENGSWSLRRMLKWKKRKPLKQLSRAVKLTLKNTVLLLKKKTIWHCGQKPTPLEEQSVIFRKHFSEIERRAEANLKQVSMMKLWIFLLPWFIFLLLSLDSSYSCFYVHFLSKNFIQYIFRFKKWRVRDQLIITKLFIALDKIYKVVKNFCPALSFRIYSTFYNVDSLLVNF